MARPDFAHSRWPADHQLSLDLEGFAPVDFTPTSLPPLATNLDSLASPGGEAEVPADPLVAECQSQSPASSPYANPWLPGDTIRVDESAWLQEQQKLRDNLAQAQAMKHQQMKRISHLEQALDQAMACLDELRHQLQEQEMLEAQLAMTEEYANVQQQAIIRLKSQLAERAVSETPPDQSESPSNGSLLAILKALAPSREANAQSIQDLGQALVTAHHRIESLSEELEDRATLQARLHHTCQELTTERDRLQSRATLLEQQNAELQEQVLEQAKQISDYETGVQHWKDRYLAAQRQMLKLRELLEQIIADPQPESLNTVDIEPILTELLKMTQESQYHSTESSAALSNPTESAIRLAAEVNIPEFLLRRRRSQAQP